MELEIGKVVKVLKSHGVYDTYGEMAERLGATNWHVLGFPREGEHVVIENWRLHAIQRLGNIILVTSTTNGKQYLMEEDALCEDYEFPTKESGNCVEMW